LTANKKYIAITAAGSVSPLGMEWNEIGASCFSGKSFIKSVNLNGENVAAAAVFTKAEEAIQELKNQKKPYQYLDRSVHLAILAARQMKEYLHSRTNTNSSSRVGINIGSSRGATESFEKHYENYIQNNRQQTSVFSSPTTTLGNVSSWVMQDLGLNGFALSHSITCSTAIQAIANAVAWLKADMADIFIAGATEAPLTPFTIAQMRALKIYSQDSGSAFPCRPLSAEKNPLNMMVLGEGAALFVLEKLTSEEIKIKKPLAVIESVGWGSEEIDGFTNISEEGKCFKEAMKMALSSANKKAELIDAVLLHAPGTLKGDKAEINAIKEVFGDNLPALFSNKWQIGHSLGASAALNLVLALQILQHKQFPAFPYEISVPAIQPKQFKSLLINAAGFGGNGGSLLVSSPENFVI
jgi:3-oxoacyl-(acyl-carrier-protein) synthase